MILKIKNLCASINRIYKIHIVFGKHSSSRKCQLILVLHVLDHCYFRYLFLSVKIEVETVRYLIDGTE
jgi:hypothetical protein